MRPAGMLLLIALCAVGCASVSGAGPQGPPDTEAFLCETPVSDSSEPSPQLQSVFFRPEEESIVEETAISPLLAFEPTAENFFDQADLVVVGSPMEYVRTFFPYHNAGYPFTEMTVEVLEVLKGEAGRSLHVASQGGTISMGEVIANNDPQWNEKTGLNRLSAFERAHRYARIYPLHFVDMYKGEKYVFFLKYSEELDIYCHSGYGYQVFVLEDEQTAVNPVSGFRCFLEDLRRREE